MSAGPPHNGWRSFDPSSEVWFFECKGRPKKRLMRQNETMAGRSETDGAGLAKSSFLSTRGVVLQSFYKTNVDLCQEDLHFFRISFLVKFQRSSDVALRAESLPIAVDQVLSSTEEHQESVIENVFDVMERDPSSRNSVVSNRKDIEN